MERELHTYKLIKDENEILSTFAQNSQEFDQLVTGKQESQNMGDIDLSDSKMKQFSLAKGEQEVEDKFPTSSFGFIFDFEQEESIIERMEVNSEPKDNQQFQNVFIAPRNLNKRTNRAKSDKNCNTMKHLMKEVVGTILLKKYGVEFRNDHQIKEEIKNMVFEQQNRYKRIKNHNNNLKAMRKIFGECPSSSNSKKRSFMMRKVTQKIIMQSMIPQVLGNSQIPNKKLYILSFLMQSHRCANTELMERTQLL